MAESSLFNTLASEYDGWFERDGRLIFDIESEAFHAILPSLPKPWVEIGVGSGRFAQALGIQMGTLNPTAIGTITNHVNIEPEATKNAVRSLINQPIAISIGTMAQPKKVWVA